MSKPKIPNQRNEYKKLNARLNKYVLQVEDIYTAITEQAAQMATRVGYGGDREFRFSDYPQIKAQVDEMTANYVADMENLIYAGTSAEWANSNLVQDLLVNNVLKAYNAQVSGEKYKVYYDHNSEHLRAFQTRRDRGMNLSQRLWNQSSDMLTELEETISTAIQKGMSAVTLSKRISKYLQDFPKMQKDYAKRYGKATRSYDCEYRSIRLARSEINMAYRSSENERWRKLDFVVGYEIKVSHKHTVPDICDDLAGKYPKDFEWVGWHPNCTDYKIPILKTEDEFFSIDDKPSVNEVKDVPDSFKQWVRDNQASIKRAEARGTTPYFVRDNRKLVDGLMKKELPKPIVHFTEEEMYKIKDGSMLFGADRNYALRMQERIFHDFGFTDEEIKKYRNLIDAHRHGSSDQEYADFEILDSFRDDDSRIGALLRLQSNIEEEAYRLYRENNPPLTVYRAGAMDRDSFSFTYRKGGVVQVVDGEEVEWGYDIITDLDELIKENRLVAGLIESNIGYQGEDEIFLIRKTPKYMTKELAKVERDRRKSMMEEKAKQEALKDVNEQIGKLSTEIMLEMGNKVAAMTRDERGQIMNAAADAIEEKDIKELKRILMLLRSK